MKLVQVSREGSRRNRRYDQPGTPLDRLLDSNSGDSRRIEELRAFRERTDPFDLATRPSKSWKPSGRSVTFVPSLPVASWPMRN